MDIEETAQRLIDDLKNTMESIQDQSALAFSGGIDSTLLMHLSDYKLKAYTVGMNGSRDIQNAIYISSLLNFDFKYIWIKEQDVLEAYEFLRKLDSSITIQEAGYESVFYFTLKKIEEKTLVTGQGSDELFYGYRKYIDQEISNSPDLDKLLERTAPREELISREMGKRAVMPYMSLGVRDIASSVKKEDCIKEGINKVIVRKAAELSGLPEEAYMMQKKAAQYGSGIQKVLNRIK